MRAAAKSALSGVDLVLGLCGRFQAKLDKLSDSFRSRHNVWLLATPLIDAFNERGRCDELNALVELEFVHRAKCRISSDLLQVCKLG